MSASTVWAGVSAPAICDPSTTPPIFFTDPARADLHIYRGDTGRFMLSIKLPDGTLVDVSTATWDCDIRASADAPDPPLATLDVNLVNATTIEVVLDAATSGALTGGVAVWDLQMTLNGEIQTLLHGEVFVIKDVSRP